jgi:hypothetical protein
MNSLKLTAIKLQYGAGIYDAGDTSRCYTKLFVTDSGRVLPLNHRVLSEDDILQAYAWGVEDTLEKHPLLAEDAPACEGPDPCGYDETWEAHSEEIPF